MPLSASEGFFLSLPILHALGSILALVLSFACDTGKGVQTATVPRILPGYTDNNFLASYPWDEDNDFITHTWNPFALIFLFESLTAGFALRPLAYFFDGLMLLRIWLVWLVLSLIGFVVWSLTNSGGVCVAMLLTGLFSFIVSAVIAVSYFAWPETTTSGPVAKAAVSRELFRDPSGRVWNIPSLQSSRTIRPRFKALHDYTPTPDSQDAATEVAQARSEFEAYMGVAIRYAEYCVTAPLLFLAVVCLLTQNAPAWLFLTGYWLLVVCNSLGIVLHLNFMYDEPTAHEEKGGLVPWLFTLIFSGPWSSYHSNQNCLLQAAWLSLLVPMSGLIFMIRGYIFSPQLPVLAQFMIWNLLATYSLFGVVPTFVYITRIGRNSLPALLDILNIGAKFPLPIIILIGFITRPATTKFCYN